MLTNWTKEDCLSLKTMLMRKEGALFTKAIEEIAETHLKRLASVDASNALEVKKLQTIAVEFPRLLRGIQEELDSRLKDLHS